MSDQVTEFIQKHIDADLQQLLLSARKYPDIPVAFAVNQIAALRKVKSKIPSWFSPALRFPPMVSVEQSSSEMTAIFKSNLFSGRRMADLTGGMGIDSFFWAKSFETVDYVEQFAEIAEAAKHNFAVLNQKNITVYAENAEQFLTNSNGDYDLIYLDPARRDDRNNRVFQLTDCQPDVVRLRDLLLAKSKYVLIKTAPMLDIIQAIKQLEKVKKIWVVAAAGECKEVLYLMDNEEIIPPSEVQIAAISLPGIQRPFQFKISDEAAAQIQFDLPQQYLYEPDAAVMKTGAFKFFGAHFGLSKLHPNTHLYTSNNLKDAVPGRSFSIQAVVKYDHSAVKQAVPEGKANIAARNFPDSPEQVRKKLKLTDGGDWYLFAATLADNSRKIIVCQKT